MNSPEVDAFQLQIEALRSHPLLAPRLKRGKLELKGLSLEDLGSLLQLDAARYFLLAAAKLNRTTLKSAIRSPATAIMPKRQREAYAVQATLPHSVSFADVASSAVALREGTLDRSASGRIESLFRDRLKAEKIPIFMAPPNRVIPGILIKGRKPDGVYPDPSLGLAPLIYLEIKNIRRVSDDIQKRLYEVAEASLEMKLLYGNLRLDGFGIDKTSLVLEHTSEYRSRLRAAILRCRPIVVVLMLCPRDEAEKYRDGAEAFVDRVFFQEEVEDCIRFLKETIKAAPAVMQPRP